MKNKPSIIVSRIIAVFVVLVISLAFFGCGGSDGSSNWVDDSSIVRVSNLKGRVIVPIDNASSARSSAQAYFSLLTTEGTKVFIEDNPNLYAVADVD